MKVSILILISTLLGIQTLKPSDLVDKDNFDEKYLSKLVVEKINEQRAINSVQELAPNDFLQKAADDHALYMGKHKELTHKQVSPEKAKAKLRIKYYNGKMRGVGENVAAITIFKKSRYKNPDGTFEDKVIKTYNEMATAIVNEWLASPAHKGNMLYAKFEFGAISLNYNSSNSMLYVAHVLAYDYTE